MFAVGATSPQFNPKFENVSFPLNLWNFAREELRNCANYCVIKFQVRKVMKLQYINVTPDRQTDGRTDGRTDVIRRHLPPVHACMGRKTKYF